MSRKKSLSEVEERGHLTAAQLEIRRKQEAAVFELGIPATPPYLWNNRPLWALWKKNAHKGLASRQLAYSDGEALLQFCQCELLGDREGMRRIYDATWKARPPFPDPTPLPPGVPTLTEFLERVKSERATFAQRMQPDETLTLDSDGKPYAWPEGDPAAVGRLYCQQVTQGAILACDLIRRACARHLNDLETGKERGLYFDVVAARHIVQFSEWFCGITLFPWQVFILTNLFGWKMPSGLRRFVEAWVSCSKKNGKTALSSCVALWGLVCDQEKFPDIFSAATKKDQSRLCWRDARRAVSASPELRTMVHVWAGSLNVPDTDGTFSPLSSDVKSMDGLRPFFIIADEVAFWDDREQFDKLIKGTVSRTQPLTFSITTVGRNRDCFAWSKFDLAEKVLTGVYANDRLFAALYSLDKQDSWEDPTTWVKANPSLNAAGMLTCETLAATAEEVRQSPSGLNSFLQYHCNIWPELSLKTGGSLPLEKWDACRGPYPEAMSHGEIVLKFASENKATPCYGGFDLGISDDLTAFVVLFPKFICNGELIRTPACLARFWMPEAGLLDKEKRWQVPITQWVREKLIKAIPGDMVDPRVVRQDLQAWCTNGCGRILEIAYDPYEFQASMAEIQENNHNIVCVKLPQRETQLTQPSREFKTAALLGRFAHLGNPVLRWMASNVALEPNPNRSNGIKPEKCNGPHGKIDGITALVCAWERILTLPPENDAPDRGRIRFI
jgi:phage terminase large subunit-like protein